METDSFHDFQVFVRSVKHLWLPREIVQVIQRYYHPRQIVVIGSGLVAAYSPWTNEWTARPGIKTTYKCVVAVQLSSRKILAGFGRSDSIYTCHLIDTAMTWAKAGNFLQTQWFGDYYSLGDNKSILHHAPFPDYSKFIVNSYDEKTGRWAITEEFEIPFPLCLGVSGRIALLADREERLSIYDLVTNQSTVLPPSPQKITHASSMIVLPSGAILVSNRAECELFADDRWVPTGSMHRYRIRPQMVLVDSNTVMAVGGQDFGGKWLNSVELFNIREGQWRQGPPLPESLTEGAALSLEFAPQL